MISRDSRIQIIVVILSVGVLLLAEYANVPNDGPLGIALAAVVYGLVFGGAHLYLALARDDGLIPVESRWRYVAALTIVLLSAALIALVGDRAVGPTSVETLGFGAIVVTVAGYLLFESVAGYRASRA